jgi:ADP-heptose:LPS heptosyltransferase
MTAPAIRHLVILRTDRIGDLLVSTPAIRNLRRALPDARLTLVTSPDNADVLRGWDAIDAIEPFDARWPRGTRRDWIRRMRQAAPDAVCAFRPWRDDYLLARRLRTPVRAGLAYAARPLDALLARALFTHPLFSFVPESPRSRRQVPHHAEELLAVVRKMGLPAEPVPMDVPVAEKDRRCIGEALRALQLPPRPPIVLHLSHKWLAEGWTAVDVVVLLQALANIDVAGRAVAVTVGPADQETWKAVRTAWSAEAAAPGFSVPQACGPGNLATVLAGVDGGLVAVFDHLTPGRWTALVASAGLVVSTDTGALHLASATHRPVVGVYARRRFHVLSRQWGPWMVPNRVIRKQAGAPGVEEIAAAAAALLAETREQA